MTADPEARQPASTEIDRTAHAYCPRCYPDPQSHDVITALCGVTYPFLGRRDRPVNTCKTCQALADEVVLNCGHSG